MASAFSPTSSAVTAPRIADRAGAAARVDAIPWYVWSMMLATTSVMAGEYWDISWHISIGRDTFWTPAHMAIQLAAVIAAVSASWRIFSTTFGSDRALKASSVNVLGFRGPLAAFIAAWGGGMMLTSAPFDNWWHNAYGLDVKIVSPPHTVLALGVLALNISALLTVSTEHNRATGTLRRRLDWTLLYVAAAIIVQMYVFGLEKESLQLMHSSIYYENFTGMLVILIAIATVSDSRWAVTALTGIYTALWLAGLYIMPMFSTAPRLGPVYQHITHFVPLWFPALLIVPGIAIDLVRRGMTGWGGMHKAVVLGPVFVLALVAAQWPFADFLMTPAARNWVFGTNYFVYWDSANIYYDPYHFMAFDKSFTYLLIRLALVGISTAMVWSWVGFHFGRWMKAEQR